MTTIRLAETNVDGSDTNVSVIVAVDAPFVTVETIDRIKARIEKFKAENKEWESDDLFDEAVEQLKSEGFKVTYATPTIEIEF